MASDRRSLGSVHAGVFLRLGVGSNMSGDANGDVILHNRPARYVHPQRRGKRTKAGLVLLATAIVVMLLEWASLRLSRLFGVL